MAAPESVAAVSTACAHTNVITSDCIFLQKGEYEITDWVSRGTIHILGELLMVCVIIALTY